MDADRARYIRKIVRQGPTETGYAFFRARRRRRNVGDEDLELSPSDRLVLSGGLDVEVADLDANDAVLRAQRSAGQRELGTLQWLVPDFHLVWGGGIHTLLRFADHVRRRGVQNRFHLYNTADPGAADRVSGRLAQAFPGLASSPVTISGSQLPASDAAIATAWESIWPLVALRSARSKFLFVQDWEPDFYPAGSASAMLEEAARIGFPAIVNSPGLAEVYRGQGSPAVSFTPAVDGQRFRPPATRPGAPLRIFFYARPRTARNAFGLGLAALRRIKERYGDGVEIVCAGEPFSPGQYGAADVLENRGMLTSLDEVAELYRSCHVGLVFMLSRHPSYQPLEFMASGMATVSNENPHTGWLLRHEQNALLSPPVPALVAEQIGRLVEDAPLRERLAAAGREAATAADWEDELEGAWLALSGARPFE